MRSKSYKDSKSDDVREERKHATKPKGKKQYSGRNSKSKNLDTAGLNGAGRDNDPNYYFVSKELAEQAAQLSFQNMIGFGSVDGYVVPSICRVEMNASPGCSYGNFTVVGTPALSEWSTVRSIVDDKRGINLMSSKLYTMLSTFTGRTSNYAPQDVAMMLLSISAIAELSEVIRRAFGIALTYNPRNRNLPLGLLKSMGLDVVDFIANIPAYRMRFNVAMTRINQIPLLDNIAFIRKSREIYQRVYMDGTGPMSQIFYYMPKTLWILDETTLSSGSYLYPANMISDNATNTSMSYWLDNLELMITRLLESSTLNLIYADLLNMANKIKVPTWQFDYLAENYVVMPEFNANALLQFHHMRVLGSPISLENSAVYLTKRWIADPTETTRKTPEFTVTSSNAVICDPNKNNIIYNPAFKDSTYTKVIVDMPTGSPTLEDRIEALRFSAANSGVKIDAHDVTSATIVGNLFYDTMVVLPDHYVTRLTYFRNVDYTNTNAPRTYLNSTVVSQVDEISSGNLDLHEKFYKHPLIIQVDNDTYTSIDKLYGDLDFYTTVDSKYLSRVNEMMYTGLFDFRV